MSMQPDFDNDMTEAVENAEKSEVVCVIIPFINQCLVLDSRQAKDDPPRLTVSQPLGSGERRLRHVNQARPRMKHSRELAVIPWVGSIQSLASSGAWDMIARRMINSGFPDAASACDEALDELRQWERRALASMIRGQGPFHTLWSRSGAR